MVFVVVRFQVILLESPMNTVEGVLIMSSYLLIARRKLPGVIALVHEKRNREMKKACGMLMASIILVHRYQGKGVRLCRGGLKGHGL